MGAIIKILSEIGLGKWALIVLGLSIFVDLSPIKLNPIKAIISFIGKYFNNAVQGKIDEFEVKVNTKIDNFQSEINVKLDQLQKEQNAQRDTLNKIVKDREAKEISRLKWEVIEFETSIRNSQKHNREQYRHVLDSADTYARMVCNEDRSVSVPQEDLIHVKESAANIQDHYDKHRSSQDLYF